MSARELIKARVRAEADRAAARAELLPFGDGYLDDDRPDFHGTNVGLQRHAVAGEPPCSPCAALLGELVAAGLARPVDGAPDLATADMSGYGHGGEV